MKASIIQYLICVVLALQAQAAVIYTDGPSFEIPLMGNSRSLDINNDGVADFVFRSDLPITTMDVPPSGSSWPFHLVAVGTNHFLVKDYALVQRHNVLISSKAPAEAEWSAPGASAPLTAHWTHLQGNTVTEGWNGS